MALPLLDTKLELVHQLPETPGRLPPVLFLHGGWHGAWCWKAYQRYFAEQGVESYALSYRGHGESPFRGTMRRVRYTDYLADIRWALDTFPRPPILVAHSMGGYLVQKLLEEEHAFPAVVLVAPIPVSGALRMFAKLLWQHPWISLRTHLGRDGGLVVRDPARVREMFLSRDVDRAVLEDCHARLRPESYRLGLETALLALPRPARVTAPPMLVLAGEDDQLFTVEEERRTARAYGADFEVMPNTAHDIMLERHNLEAADRILRFISTYPSPRP